MTFVTQQLSDHHVRALSAADRIVYYSSTQRPAGGVNWFFHHEFFDPPNSAPPMIVFGGSVYHLAFVTRHAPPSGWDWYVYRRDE